MKCICPKNSTDESCPVCVGNYDPHIIKYNKEVLKNEETVYPKPSPKEMLIGFGLILFGLIVFWWFVIWLVLKMFF